MNALVKSRAERGLWLEEIAVPQIGINDVLVRVCYTGICGTTRSSCSACRERSPPPLR